jgi:hypothetical protein
MAHPSELVVAQIYEIKGSFSTQSTMSGCTNPQVRRVKAALRKWHKSRTNNPGLVCLRGMQAELAQRIDDRGMHAWNRSKMLDGRCL